MNWYSESARLLHLGHIARTCLWRKAWTVCKPQRSSECYQRQMAWRWSDNEKSYFAVEKVFGSSSKAEWRTYSVHFLLISWLMITVTLRCGLMRTSDDMNEWSTACKHCFMICNTISFVSRLIRKCFRRKFLDLFRDVCSLNVCFSLHLFWLLCCIMPWESSGRFLCATRYMQQCWDDARLVCDRDDNILSALQQELHCDSCFRDIRLVSN